MSGRICQIMTSYSASVNGKERNSAALIMLKIAVLAPMSDLWFPVGHSFTGHKRQWERHARERQRVIRV
jgi:hypothetical protein